MRSERRNMAEFGDIYKEQQAEFEERFAPFIDQVGSLNELFEYVQEKVDNAPDQSSKEFKVLYFLFRQVIEEFNAIVILSTNGFSRGSTILLRSMFEHCTTLMFFQKSLSNEIDPNGDTIERFIDYWSVSRRKGLFALKEAYEGDFKEEDFVHIEDEYQKVKSMFTVEACKKCGSTRPAISWSKRDTVSLAKLAGMPQTVIYFCYSEAITYAHPSMAYIDSRFKISEDGWNYQFSSSRDEWKTVSNAHLMTLMACQAIFKFLGIPDAELLVTDHAARWQECWDLVRIDGAD